MAGATEVPVRRLNPFSFRAETDTLFALLIVAGVMVSLVLGTLFQHIFEIAPESIPTASVDVGGELDFDLVDEQTLLHGKRAWIDVAMLVVPGLAVFGLAWVLYRRHPDAVRRRHGLVSFPVDKDPDFASEIHELAGLAHVSPVPGIEMKPGLRAQSGQAFGVRGRHVLRLDEGLRLLRRKAPPVFRALVLHELAHLANRDVGKTYFAQALWRSVLWVVLAPLIGATLWELISGQWGDFDAERLLTRNLPAMGWLWLQAGAILAVVGLVRASLLRSRELYADARAGMLGAREPLLAILRRAALKERQGGFWRSLWRLHPDADERAGVLEKPRQLFALSAITASAVGVLLGLVIEGATRSSVPLALGLATAMGSDAGAAAQSGNLEVSYAKTLLALIVAVGVFAVTFGFIGWLLAGTVGMQVQRETVASESEKTSRSGYLGLLRLALIVAVGMEVGFLLLPGLFRVRATEEMALLGLTSVGFVAWTWITLVGVRHLARWLLIRKTGEAAPRGRRRWTTLLASAWAGLALVPVLIARYVLLHVGDATDSELLWSAALGFSVTAGVVGVLAMAIHWLVSRMGGVRCPTCGGKAPERIAVGQSCLGCGQELAVWLYQDHGDRSGPPALRKSASPPPPAPPPIPVRPPPLRPPSLPGSG